MDDFTYYCDEIRNEKNEWLLFNVLTGKVLAVSDEVHSVIKKCRWERLSKKERELLTQYGFLVGSHDEEVTNLIHKFQKMKYENENLVVTILTNMDCNLGCKYCHENGLMDFNYLKDEEIEKIKEWLNIQFLSNKYKWVTIYFYGGEPMLNMYAIEKIAKYVTFLSKKFGFKYNYSMATNATLLDDELVEKLIEVDVRDMQVTLDGPSEIHDFRKPFLNGKGTFDVILHNVLKYWNKLNFTIRANVDKNNYNCIPELMNIITNYNLHKKAYFYLDLVSSTHSKNEYCTNNVFTSLEEMSSITYLWKEQKRRGIPLHGKNVIEGLCGNLSKSNVTISASGEFYICPGLCGIREACLGDVIKGFNDVYDKMMETNVWSKCIKCKYLPMCAGGCRAQAYMETGDCFSSFCKRAYYETVVMDYIKIKYEENM